MNLMQRIEANSIWEPNSGCRIWEGGLVRDHGVIKVAGRVEQVHRVAWELERGPIPKGMWVLHDCGLSPCCNVNHLRLGHRDQNAIDRKRHGGYKGRPGGGLLRSVFLNSASPSPRKAPSVATLTQDNVRTLLDYDPDSGELRWRHRADRDHSWNMRFGGEICGAVLSHGYRSLNLSGKVMLVHRIIWLWMTGEWPHKQVDHINGVRTDNRWSNLRMATQQQNSANQGLRSNNKSGVKGVSWDKRKKVWVAMITVAGKVKRIGSSRSKEEATAMRRAAEAEYQGAFARAGDA